MTPLDPGTYVAVAPPRPLPAWPLLIPVVGYPIWWASGIGEFVLPLFAAPAALILAQRRHVQLPRWFGIWLLLLLWILTSASQLDSPERVIGATYRLLLYLAVTVYFIYIFNAREGLGLRRVCGAFTLFLLIMTLGAMAGVFFPLWQVTTPLAHVLPSGLLSNELVGEMAYRKLTQFNPDAYNADSVSPRPSAPFLYTNGWGNAYSLIVPFVIMYLAAVRSGWRFWGTLALLLFSVVPAALTLNRGMFIGLAIGAIYCMGRALLAGRLTAVLAILVVSVIGMVVLALLPVQERISARNEDTSSEDVRAQVYSETWERVRASPLLGYGGPRPSRHEGYPAVGTQGQFWMVLFSHGLPAACLLLGWLLYLSRQAWRRFTLLHVAAGAIFTMALVELTYYGFMPFGYLLVMTAAALLLREHGGSTPDASLSRSTVSERRSTVTDISCNSSRRPGDPPPRRRRGSCLG